MPIDTLNIGLSLAQLEAENRPARTYVFCEPKKVSRKPFFHAEPTDPSVAPFGFLFTDPGFRDYVAPRTTASALPGAIVLGSSGVVVWRDRVVRDSLQSNQAWRTETLLADIGPEQVRLKRSIEFPGRALPGPWLHIFSGAWPNYAHWMTECMPKLLLFRWLREHVPELRLLLPDFGESLFHRQTLELFGIGEADILRLGESEVVAPEVLWYSAVIDLWATQPICRIAAEYLASVTSVKYPTAASSLERIYVRRLGPVRGVANFSGLTGTLDAAGFTVVSTDHMTLVDQVTMMQRARFVVAEHGAGVSNLMFCRPGAGVLELFNPAGAQPAHWVLASLCGIRYGFLIGRHAAEFQPTPDANAHYEIAPEQLRAGIAAMVAAANGVG